MFHHLSILLQDSNFWIFKILVFAFLATTVSYFISFIKKKIKKYDFGHSKYFIQVILNIISQPLLIYIWITYTFYVFWQLPFRGNELYTELSGYISKISLAKNLIIFWWSWFKLVRNIEKIFWKSKSSKAVRDKTKIQAIDKLITVISITFLIISVFPVFSIPISGIVAFAGSSAFVISFASKDLFANYIGGLMIFLDGHFHVGDWIIISVGGKHIEGAIEFIGWRSTLIRTPERRALFLPNYNFLSSVIENVTQSDNFRVYETVEITVDDIEKIKPITSEIYKMINSHPDIDINKKNICFLEKVTNNTATIRVLAFTKTLDRFEYRAVIQRILEECCDIIIKSGASMTIPTKLITS